MLMCIYMLQSEQSCLKHFYVFIDLEIPNRLQYIVVGVLSQPLFSVNRMPSNIHAFSNYPVWIQQNFSFIANITLYEPLDPHDSITSHRVYLYARISDATNTINLYIMKMLK